MKYPGFEYNNTKRVTYNLGEGNGNACFLPVCPKCGRYVKMDHEIYWNEHNGLTDKPNASCFKCGRIKIDCECVD